MDRRMISTSILKSSVYLRVSEKLNDELDILAAQRFFLYLILNADDKGRGRLLLPIIKMEAFITCPTIIPKITDEQLLSWIGIFVEDGAIQIYEIEGSRYYELTGWQYYQRGNWRPKESHIPTEKKSHGEAMTGEVKKEVKYDFNKLGEKYQR